MDNFHNRKTALSALLLVVPAASIAVLISMIILPGTAAGKGVFLFSKIYLLIFPVLWTVKIDRDKLSSSPVKNGGWAVGLGFGVIASVIIAAVYLLAGKYFIRPDVVKEMAEKVGLANKYIYLAGAVYWITCNSVLEEYLWRWFVVKQCRKLMTAPTAAAASALCFTFHHIIAMKVYFGWPLVAIASFGVFTGGLVWSMLYLKFRSVWPSYISHLIVDIAVFAIGYHLIFC